MKIGNYKIYAIQTGLFKLDGGAMFGVVPKPLWSRTNPPDGRNRINMCMRSLLLVSDKKKIIIDNGVGYKLSSKLNDIYGVDHTKFTLEGELAKLGYNTGDVTDVIITHLHFDHAGGSTKIDEEGKLQLMFPNATYFVQKKHWEWSQNPSERDKASFFPENFNPIKEQGHLKLLDGDTKFDEYINLYVVNGHTPAMQLVTVKDADTILLYTADLFPTTTHISPPYIMGYDLFPLTTLDEKKKFLPVIAKENWLLFFEHDAFTETCRIQQNEKGFTVIDKMELKNR
ncbi:MAG: MBL fold metallo-hydrolase [Chlorobi bacterium]|nr:MBL fold metallo-hydrolase [Chlorobiota bacterium]MCI0715450.1 MBL fold metallo-hydrolase [Chlorobiota bacterium]